MTIAFATAFFTGLALAILATVAVTAGVRANPNADVRANGGPITVFVGALAYLVLLAPKFSNGAITGAALVLLIIAVIIPPLTAGAVSGLRDKLGDSARSVFDLAGVIVAFTLLAGLLATAGEVLSLMGGVNRWIAIAAIGLCGAGYLLARGREAASRTSRWTLGFAVVIPILLLVAGAVIGHPSTITSSLVPSTAIPPGDVLGVILAVFVCGFVDPAMGLVLRGAGGKAKAKTTSVWAAVITGVFTLVFGLALILIYGGAWVAPSLQAFLLAAAPPILIAFFLFFAVFVLGSSSDSQLAAGSQVASDMSDPSKRRPITLAIVVLAILLAMFVPAPLQILAVGTLVAAAGAGAVLPALKAETAGLQALPGLVVGVVAALVVALIMGLSNALTFTTATAVAIVAAVALSAITSLILAKRAPAAVPAA